MKTKKKKPTNKEMSTRIEYVEGKVNTQEMRAYTQAKLFTELISFLGKENEFKEHLKLKYIPENAKKRCTKAKYLIELVRSWNFM